MIKNILYILLLIGEITCRYHQLDDKKLEILPEHLEFKDDYTMNTNEETSYTPLNIKKIEEKKEDKDKYKLTDHNHIEFLNKYPYDTNDYTIREMMKADFDSERDVFSIIPDILKSIDSLIESAIVNMKTSDNEHSDKCNCFSDNLVRSSFDEMEPNVFRLKRDLIDDENKTNSVTDDLKTKNTTEYPEKVGTTAKSESITEIIHNLLNASAVLRADTTATPDLKETNINVLKKYLSSVQDSLKLNNSDSELTKINQISEHHDHQLTTVANNIEELKKMREVLQSTLQAVTSKHDESATQETVDENKIVNITTELNNDNISEVGIKKLLQPSLFDFFINIGSDERNLIINENNTLQEFSKEGSNSISKMKEYIPLEDDEDLDGDDDDDIELKHAPSMSSIGVAFVVIGVTIIVAFVLLTIYAVQKQQQLMGVLPSRSQRQSQQNVVTENAPENQIPMEPRTSDE